MVTESDKKVAPGDYAEGYLLACTAGRIRTHDLLFSQKSALSAELQRHTSAK